MISPNRNPTPAPGNTEEHKSYLAAEHQIRNHYPSVRQCKNKGTIANRLSKKQKQTKKDIMQVGNAWGLGAKTDDVSTGAD
jgi:hypothetical protein